MPASHTPSSDKLIQLGHTVCNAAATLLGRCGPDLGLLLLYEALILAQDRPRGGIGSLLEQGSSGSGVRGPRLCPLQPGAPPSFGCIRVR